MFHRIVSKKRHGAIFLNVYHQKYVEHLEYSVYIYIIMSYATICIHIWVIPHTENYWTIVGKYLHIYIHTHIYIYMYIYSYILYQLSLYYIYSIFIILKYHILYPYIHLYSYIVYPLSLNISYYIHISIYIAI